MATSQAGPGRTFPAQGVDGEVPYINTDEAADIQWGAAANVKYIATTTGDWPGTDPVTIGAALDTLAARVTTLEA